MIVTARVARGSSTVLGSHTTTDHMVPEPAAHASGLPDRSAAHLEQAYGAQPAVERVTAEVAAYHRALRALGVNETRAAVQHAVVVHNEALAWFRVRV